jgi:hypothetical protein
MSRSRPEKRPAEADSKCSLKLGPSIMQQVPHIFELPSVTTQKTILFIVTAMRTMSMYTFGYKSERHELKGT